MFWIIKKRYIICSFILVAIILCAIIFSSLKTEYVYLSPNSEFLVVIDAGHGGIDGGSVGKTTGVYESVLNLEYAKNLANQLNQMNISAVLTRTSADGLYESNVKNLKKSDMKMRKEIIEKNNPNLVVSIHMNSFPLSSSRGAQSFYKKDNEQGKALSDCIQSQLFLNLAFAKTQSKVGDYYIINCTERPSVLVECGFLSNAEEEKLLTNLGYQNQVCYSIMCGIVAFLTQKY